MTKNSPTGLGIKVVILTVALCGVFYLISQLRSPNLTSPRAGEKNPLALIFGGDTGRPLNWCPQDVQRLQIESTPSEVTTDQVQIQSYCQLLAESFDSSGLDMKSFKPIIKAFGSAGTQIVIEADSSGKIFRFQGLPFGSKQLSRQLEKKIQR